MKKTNYYSKELVEIMKELYLKNYSSTQIREVIFKEYKIKVCSAGIINRLRKEGVSIRRSKDGCILQYRRKAPIEKIVYLYKEGKTMRDLSREFRIGRKTIRKILEENFVDILNSRSARIARGDYKEKEKFNLNPNEKAYLFGLVMGDLTPVRKSNFTLKLITHTTHKTFADMLHQTFGKYGLSNYKENKVGEFRYQTFLDLDSFSFLLNKKEIPEWIDNTNYIYFIAGFIDSEGCLMVKKIRTNFQFIIRFSNEDLNTLNKIKEYLENRGFHVSVHKGHKKGDESYNNGVRFRYNNDYYNFDVCRRGEVISLLKLIPIRHPEKIAKRELIYKFETKKYTKWENVEDDIKILRSLIKTSVKSKQILDISTLKL